MQEEKMNVPLVIFLLMVGMILLWHRYYYRFPIDAVYTWVDMDPDLKKKMQEDKTEDQEARFRQYDELLFSVRSLEKYAPWIRRIYIVVHDGQAPPWFYPSERLRLVPHSRIIPARYLPTYNSLCIESFLHEIPGLAEHYIYLNDDLVLLRPVHPWDFFTLTGRTYETDGHPIVMTHRISEADVIVDKESRCIRWDTLDPVHYEYHRLMAFNGALIMDLMAVPSTISLPLHTSDHIPSANRISHQRMLTVFLHSLSFTDREGQTMSMEERTRQARFRDNRSIARNSLVKKYWNLIHHGSCLLPASRHQMMYVEIDGKISHKERFEWLASNQHPFRFLCIQNMIDYHPASSDLTIIRQGEKDYERILQILHSRFPIPCALERIL